MNRVHSVWHRLVTSQPKPPAIPSASYRDTYCADSQLLFLWQTTPHGWACFDPQRVCFNTILNCWRCSHPDTKGLFSFLRSLLHPKMHSDKNKWRGAALSTDVYLEIYIICLDYYFHLSAKCPLSEKFLTYYEMSQLNTFLRHRY